MISGAPRSKAISAWKPKDRTSRKPVKARQATLPVAPNGASLDRIPSGSGLPGAYGWDCPSSVNQFGKLRMVPIGAVILRVLFWVTPPRDQDEALLHSGSAQCAMWFCARRVVVSCDALGRGFAVIEPINATVEAGKDRAAA